MGILINTLAEGAQMRAVSLSWVSINTGYARSELNSFGVGRSQSVAWLLIEELDGLLQEIQRAEMDLAEHVRTFERDSQIQSLEMIGKTLETVCEAIASWGIALRDRLELVSSQPWAQSMADMAPGEQAALSLMGMLGIEVLPQLLSARISFEKLVPELQRVWVEERKSHEA
jgi:hypothetical protein